MKLRPHLCNDHATIEVFRKADCDRVLFETDRNRRSPSSLLSRKDGNVRGPFFAEQRCEAVIVEGLQTGA